MLQGAGIGRAERIDPFAPAFPKNNARSNASVTYPGQEQLRELLVLELETEFREEPRRWGRQSMAPGGGFFEPGHLAPIGNRLPGNHLHTFLLSFLHATAGAIGMEALPHRCFAVPGCHPVGVIVNQPLESGCGWVAGTKLLDLQAPNLALGGEIAGCGGQRMALLQ